MKMQRKFKGLGFSLGPGEAKVMKTQDKETIFIECNNEAWKFKSAEYDIHYETGLFFGKKNNFLENQNILISGIVKNETQEMKWEIERLV